MPIKFRCVHCGQYLGISRAKAGTVVDCPTCGRSVKVPLKDGEAERVGAPSLDHADSQLAEALNEVAAIAESSGSALPQLPPRSPRVSDVRETREVHAPPPTIIPAAPQPAAERIEPPDEETFSPTAALDELASLASADAPMPSAWAAGPSPLGQFPWTNELPWKWWLAIIAVGFVALIIGFALGRWDEKIEAKSSAPGTKNGEAQQSAKPPAPPGIDPMNRLGRIALRGAVKTSSGKNGAAIQPDENAWIYAFPLEAPSGQKIPAEWFSSSDREPMIAALRLLGGNAARTGKDGGFELRLIRPGRYHVLVCSSRKTDAAETVPEFLKAYVEDPKAFLDRRLFHAEQVDYKGAAIDLNLEPLQP